MQRHGTQEEQSAIDTIGTKACETNRKIERHLAPALARLLPAKLIRKWAAQAGTIARGGLYSPTTALRQCIAKQLARQSTRALEHNLALIARVCQGRSSKRPPETTPDGKDFCHARANLGLAVFRKALSYVAGRRSVPAADRYGDLTIGMLDGTTVALVRSKENREHFKTSSNQHGQGRFPIARIALLFCAGLIAALAVNPYLTSELAQAVELLRALPSHQLLLADALYGTFLNLVLVTQRGSHLICPRHPKRKGQRLKRLGPGEWLERLAKPRACHCHCPELLAGMPEFVDVRAVQTVIHRKGYRDFTLVLYTTLLDPRQYPAADIVALYLRRWSIELDIRTLKLQHGLDRPTCKSPATVEREIYSACLAFNCVRATMAQTGQQVHRLSHTEAQRILATTDTYMAFATRACRAALVHAMLIQISAAILRRQLRPPEPRAVVHSARRFPYLSCSRRQWKAWHHVAA